jgi:hypothetical protein
MAGRFRLSDHSQLLQGQPKTSGNEDPPVDRDVFEHDVAEILSLLIDAKDDLEAGYEDIRKALRKLNSITLEHGEKLSSLQSKLEVALTKDDKLALQKFSETASAVGVNIVSSGLWTYAIEPVLRVL